MEFYVPKRRIRPFRIIPPAREGEQPIVVPDFGCLDNSQFEDIVAKVQEQRKQPPKRVREPSIVTIETFIDKRTRMPVRYLVERKPV